MNTSLTKAPKTPGAIPISDDEDETQKYGLILLTAVVGAVVAGVIGYAVTHRSNGQTKAPVTQTIATPPVQGKSSENTLQAPPAIVSPQTAAAAIMQPPAPAAIASPSIAAVLAPSNLYFAVGSGALPNNAAQILSLAAQAAQQAPTKALHISGFHDASGNAALNADLAKRRALAVRSALQAMGIAPERLIMEKPALTTGGTDPREARRVELHLR
jgi:outer membrane protein OmpA-like peptidoglycan-associated protein